MKRLKDIIKEELKNNLTTFVKESKKETINNPISTTEEKKEEISQ
jgi:hypothetical protein